MLRHHSRRLTTTVFVVLSLLFTQLALASYVCPGQPGTAAMAGMMAAGEPCEGMDQVQPVLCHEYAQQAPQLKEAVKLPPLSLPVLVQVLVVPLVLDTEPALQLAVAGEPEARPPPDPLFLSTLRLRV